MREARDEVARELQVRNRCYPNWVKEGRLSETEASDRYDRLKAALDFLTAAIAEQGEPDKKPF